MGYSIGEVRRAFSSFFIGIAVGVAVASILSEFAYRYNAAALFYAIIWVGILGGTVYALRAMRPDIFKVMNWRFARAVNWPTGLKVTNGICWAAPFAMILVLPDYYSFLVLLGIGLGNASTYLISKRVDGISFSEQLVVGAISLGALPVIMLIGSMHIFSADLIQLFARLSIALAYGTGGMYAFISETI
jgi:hypothetical protein